MAVTKRSSKKKVSKLSKIVRAFNPRSLKGGMMLFALVFSIAGGGYYAYRSFAATYSTIESLSVGGTHHACAVKTDTSLWCWGYGTFGAVGHGTTTHMNRPTKIISSGVAAVTTGNTHTCALKTNGTVFCWGNNGSGQLGINSTDRALKPTQLFISEVKQIDAGNNHTCAVKTNGSVFCWGNNEEYQIGDGNKVTVKSPKQIYIANVRSVSLGGYHSCATLNDNTVKCWGNNQNGQAGVANPISHIPTPREVKLTDVKYVSSGPHHTCALMRNGGVYCWGANQYQVFQKDILGVGSTDTVVLAPRPVYISDVKNLVTNNGGGVQTCAIKASGQVWCWGGIPSSPKNIMNVQHTPTLQNDFSKVTWLAFDEYNVCARRSDSTLACGGYNEFGTVGIGEFGDETSVERLTNLFFLF